MSDKNLFSSIAIIIVGSFFSTTAIAAPAKTAKSDGGETATTEDVFFQGKGREGVALEFDCSPKHSRSPYCMIRITDKDTGITCLGLVSSEKVVNPALSCVPAVKGK